jgi:tetratricopeptide (TPR) repeat protein
MLDLIAAAAAERGSHQEAITALDAALEHDPDDGRRRTARAAQLAALGRLAALDGVPAGSGPTGRDPDGSPDVESGAVRASEAQVRLALRSAEGLLRHGDWDAAEGVLAAAAQDAHRAADRAGGARVRWSLARVAAGRGDALLAERLFRETEQDAKWSFDPQNAITFLVDAAEQLDRLGLTAEAEGFLERAAARAQADDPTVRRGTAVLLARSGHPGRALQALGELAARRTAASAPTWRDTFLAAWASLRAGRSDAGELAARALEEAIAAGGLDVAIAAEPELVLALAPAAEAAGSPLARSLLVADRALLVRLFGAPIVTRADGRAVPLPAGRPGELVRMLAVHDHGLAVDVVLETFFPGAPASSARHRLRQVLTRLRSAAGEIVVRDEEHLRLIPAWVDPREFQLAVDRARGLHGPRAVRVAHAALAHHTGPLLPLDAAASWARPLRDQVDQRRAALLELTAADAAAHGWESGVGASPSSVH